MTLTAETSTVSKLPSRTQQGTQQGTPEGAAQRTSQRSFGERLRAVDWRSALFRALGALVMFLVLSGPGGVRDLPAAWVMLHPDEEGFLAELHRWHIVQASGLISLLLTGSLAASLLAPRQRPLVMQYMLLGVVAMMVAFSMPFNQRAVVTCGVIGVLLLAAYPAPGKLFSLGASGEGAGKASRSLLALTAVAMLPLALDVWQNARLHLSDVSEHTALGHWYHAAVIELMLVVGGLLSATRRPGWKSVGVITGALYVYFGTSAMAIPGHDGSWGVAGGTIATIIGLAYFGVLAHEARRSAVARPAVSRPALALAATVAVGMLATVACGPAPKVASAGGFSDVPAAQTVEIGVAPGKLAWEKPAYEARAGAVSFTVSNPPGLAHDFTIRGKGVEARSARFDGGTTARFTLADLKPGTYQILCTVPGHYEGGMVSTLTVS